MDYRDVELRERVKRAGARWDSRKRVWILPLPQARRLGLQTALRRPKEMHDPGPWNMLLMLETCSCSFQTWKRLSWGVLLVRRPGKR